MEIASDLFEKSKGPSFRVYSVTFLSDALCLDPLTSKVDVKAAIDKAGKVFRNYTHLNAIGIVEVQPIMGSERDNSQIFYYWHLHVILFGNDKKGAKNLSERARG